MVKCMDIGLRFESKDFILFFFNFDIELSSSLLYTVVGVTCIWDNFGFNACIKDNTVLWYKV